ncbi:MAG: type I restriction-modification system subunit M N-terminal domain-containing protein [Desulfomicrobium escambiense]|nr:type I restriction-modification system subunit M N-terminal domain-containing protein [Desulfomicrobium escambiense]
MALKKSELYSSLWKSCDELRGGMDASQYKDYVLVLLFIKYVTDKYAGQHDCPPIDDPEGRELHGHGRAQGQASDIGDKINSRSSASWPTPTTLRARSTSPTSTTPTSSARARRWWTGSPTWSPSSRTRRSISRRTAPRATTSWATPTNT